jgi:hypothetical protein
MRNLYLLFLCAVVIWSGCTGEGPGRSASRNAKIAFTDTVYRFGEIDYASDGMCEFAFTNTGRGQLVLKNVKSTCGCTVPEWPKQPVRSGDTAVIIVRYDTYRTGSFNKSIYVYSNAVNSPNRLMILGKVRPAEDSTKISKPAVK